MPDPACVAPAPTPRRLAAADLVTEMEGKPRLDLMAKLPWEMHRVVGVSFEGRQELLAELAPNDPVACAREPDNEYDPRAVAVRTLEGRGLGYIARTDTQAFLHDVAFGAVASVGVGEKGLFGATVRGKKIREEGKVCAPARLPGGRIHSAARLTLAGRAQIAMRPSLPGVEVYAFPDSVKQYAGDLGLSGEAWDAVAAREHQAAQGRWARLAAPALPADSGGATCPGPARAAQPSVPARCPQVSTDGHAGHGRLSAMVV